MDNQYLVTHLVTADRLRTPAYIKAFREIDRIRFVPPELRDLAYADQALPLGPDQTISQPSTVAMMIEWLKPQPNDRVLDIGAGSGWQTAILAKIVGKRGEVVGIEIDPKLTEQAGRRLRNLGLVQARFLARDGSEGFAEQGPWQRIIVAAAAPARGEKLRWQLTVGGTLVMPIGTDMQEIIVVTRTSKDKFDTQAYPGFLFVPLKKRDAH